MERAVSGPASVNDFDVTLFDFTANALVPNDGVNFGTSVRDQTGGADPWEIVLAVNNTGATKQYGLIIEQFSLDPLDATGTQFKTITFDDSDSHQCDFHDDLLDCNVRYSRVRDP